MLLLAAKFLFPACEAEEEMPGAALEAPCVHLAMDRRQLHPTGVVTLLCASELCLFAPMEAQWGQDSFKPSCFLLDPSPPWLSLLQVWC